MMNNNISKHIKFNQVHEDIVNEMIDTIPGVNSFSEAVRHAVLSMENQTEQQKKINAMQSKMNAMSKNIDILVEMVAGGFHKLDVKAIGNPEDSYVYQDALKHVENKIQRATTVKTNLKQANYRTDRLESFEEPKQIKIPISKTDSIFK